MKDPTKEEQVVMKAHNLFWDALAKRDIDLRFSLCADEITFIGTGLHERAKNKAEYKAINKKGVEQFPDPFRIEFLWTEVTIFQQVAWVECEVNWIQDINNDV